MDLDEQVAELDPSWNNQPDTTEPSQDQSIDSQPADVEPPKKTRMKPSKLRRKKKRQTIQDEPSEGRDDSSDGNNIDEFIQKQPESFVEELDQIIVHIYKLAKQLPDLLNERECLASNQKPLLEDWEKYANDFYKTLVEISTYTNKLIQLTLPMYFDAYRGKVITRSLHEKGLTLENISILFKKIGGILSMMDEYFFLAHYHMPSWGIYSPTNTLKSQHAVEVLFFYEICRIRVIYDILNMFGVTLHKKKINPFLLTILNKAELLPPNIDQWRFPYGVSKSEAGELMVPYYSQSQVETSFKYLFLKLNLITYHSDINNYIDKLLARLGWLTIMPAKGDVMDHLDFRAPLSDGVVGQVEDNFISVDVEFSPVVTDQPHLYICSRAFIFRSILRYWELLSKRFFRNSIFIAKRIFKNEPDITKMSSWLQKVLNRKFERVFTQMRPEVNNKYNELLIPPSDKEWCIQTTPYVSESSIWTFLYPQLKSDVMNTASKDIKTIYFKPTTTEAGIFEHIAMRLFGMFLGDSINFRDIFVFNESQILPKLQFFKRVIKMPIIIQSFNRYVLLYRGKDGDDKSQTLYEYESIFDTLAAWIITMIRDFKTETATHILIRTIKKTQLEEKKFSEKEKEKKGNEAEPTSKTNEFSTFQTKAADDQANDDNRSSFF